MIELSVNGVRYGQWASATLNMSVEAVSRMAEFEIRDQWRGRELPFGPDDECTVSVDGEKMLVGFIDAPEVRYSASFHAITIRCRDKTGQLVYGAAEGGPWRSRTIVQIASDICAPYGVSVRSDVDVGKPLSKFAVNHGDSAIDTMRRLTDRRGILLTSSRDGELVMTRAGAGVPRDAFVIDAPSGVISCNQSRNWTERHSEYRVIGKNSSSEDVFGRPTRHIKRTVRDDGIDRHRPLTIVMTGTALECLRRAEWERAIRFGRSESITYRIAGHRAPQGVWELNREVLVRDKELRINGRYVVASVTFRENSETKDVEVGVRLPEAFSIRPPGREKNKARGLKEIFGL